MMYYSPRTLYRRDSMPEKEKALNNQEELSGFIFMCNHVTKPECYRFRVFGLPEWRKEVVEKIQPGTCLFLFDCDSKLLYGIYTATSSGKLGIEESAFGGKFPAQVKFKIHQDCLPLPESCFKYVILDNYQKGGHKFSPELNLGQVKSLLLLFRPISINKQIMSTSAPALSVQHQTSESQLHLRALSPAVQNTYSAGNRGSFGGSVPEPQRTYLDMPYQYYQPEYCSLMNMGTMYGPSSQSSLHAYQMNLNPQNDFSSSTVRMGGSYAQSLEDPQHTYIRNPQSNFYSSTVNMGSSQAQSILDPQYVYRSVLNPQPVGYVNPIMQSHASSSANVPYHSDQTGCEYIPEAVTSTAYPYQGSSVVALTRSEAAEGLRHADQQTGIGYDCYGSSLQTGTDINHQQ
ncbi:hypothetical protein QN277_025734 [Acacia crassicarpa]|uniref:DCD domain-containing protein n=1 Tax=Acacia crassicarpa TaxID=499986 RepID=A0AAE1J697_9FABA|nr:hypothetical protein QN277_025734 [Acacia crassicarpa]